MEVSNRNLNCAKICVSRWYDRSNTDAIVRKKLLSGLERIARELEHRRDWFEINSVAIPTESDLSFRVKSKLYHAYPIKDNFVISTLLPGWGFGWQGILKDERVYQTLSWFLHYATQYLHLSHVTKVLLTAIKEDSAILNPFGDSLIKARYGPVVKGILPEEAFAQMKKKWEIPTSLSKLRFSDSNCLFWNLLDPMLHQAVFFYNRAHNLYNSDFLSEAFVSFDCAIQSIGHFLQLRGLCAGTPSRKDICESLNLSDKLGELAEYNYFIRNNFGAHPGGWRWWHSYEYTEDSDFDNISSLVFQILSNAAHLEKKLQLIEPNPTNWGEWLFQHFDLIWRTVWFDKIDKWLAK